MSGEVVYTPVHSRVVVTGGARKSTVSSGPRAVPAVVSPPKSPREVVTSYLGTPGADGADGQPGPPGPPGPAGPSGQSAEKYFAVPLDTWEYEHNLGFTPNVLCMIGGKSGRGVVTHNDAVRTVVEFHVPVPGRMILS